MAEVGGRVMLRLPAAPLRDFGWPVPLGRGVLQCHAGCSPRQCRKLFTVLFAFGAHTAAGGRGQGMDRCSLVKMGKTKARSGGEIRLETLSEVVAVGVLFLQCSALSSGPLCLRKELR